MSFTLFTVAVYETDMCVTNARFEAEVIFSSMSCLGISHMAQYPECKIGFSGFFPFMHFFSCS